MEKEPKKEKKDKKSSSREKKELFAKAYIMKKFNATEAAIQAGFSKKTARQKGCNLLEDEEVIELIRKEKELLEEEYKGKILSAVDVLVFLSDVVSGNVKDAVLAFEGKNQVIIQKEASLKEKIEAAKMLAKFHQLFTDKVSIEGVATIVFSGEDQLED